MIIGDDSMDSVVGLADARMLAVYIPQKTEKATSKTYKAYQRPLAKYFATDSFTGTSHSSLEDTTTAFTLHSCNASFQDVGADVLSQQAADHYEVLKTLHFQLLDMLVESSCPANKVEAARVTSMELFDKLDATDLSTKTADTYLLDGVPSLVSSRVNSPITVATDTADHPDGNQGFGWVRNGLSLTKKGIAYGLVHLLAQAKECGSMKLVQYLDMHAMERCKNIIGDAKPVTKTEIVLTGGAWKVHDFEIEKVIGGGTFGRVNLARLVSDKSKKVALKVESNSADDFFKYTIREYEAVGKLRCANVARVYGFIPIPFIYTPSKPICFGLLMEVCGDNLLEIHKRMEGDTTLTRGAKVSEYCRIVLQILSAVSLLEQHHIYHRDIKLENICEGLEDKLFKLIDFGLARNSNEDGTMTNSVGTKDYIPPEGSSGDKHDVFSLGVVFYKLVSGEFPPPPGAQQADIKYKKRVSKKLALHGIDIAPPISNDIINLTLAMTAALPGDRISAEQAYPLMKAIVEALDSQ